MSAHLSNSAIQPDGVELVPGIDNNFYNILSL